MRINMSCQLLGYSKQAYYKRLNSLENTAFDEYLIVELVRKKRQLWKKGSGRNLLICLQTEFAQHNIQIGRDRFFDLLRRHNLLVKKRSYRAITTNSYHFFRRYPNKIKGVIPQRSNHIWVSDITYVWIQKEECFLYLFLITDMYSRKIVGYNLAEDLKAIGAVQALKMALAQADDRRNKEIVHHSDRGIQYCSYQYTALLEVYNIEISMTENSNPLDNPIAERINKTIKEEFMDDYKLGYDTFERAKQEIPKNIAFYNQERPHRSIEMLTPNEAHKRTGPLKKMWKNYYQLKP